MAAQLIAGTLFFKIDGQQFQARGAFKVQPNLFSKTGLAGQDGIHGYKEEPIIPYIEGEISDAGGLSLRQLQSVTDSTITCELRSGKGYVLQNAWYSGETVLDTVEGKVPVKFEGLDCQEDVA